METNSVTISDVPVYPDVPTYLNILGSLHIWEGDGWKAESLSWKTGAYIASNLSGLPELTFKGPNAQEFLSRLSINNVYKWPIGASKHLVMPDENGYIANHALTVRDSEESFRQFASMPWAMYKAPELGLEVEISLRNISSSRSPVLRHCKFWNCSWVTKCAASNSWTPRKSPFRGSISGSKSSCPASACREPLPMN